MSSDDAVADALIADLMPASSDAVAADAAAAERESLASLLWLQDGLPRALWRP